MALRYPISEFSTKIKKIKKCAWACGQYWRKVLGKSGHILFMIMHRFQSNFEKFSHIDKYRPDNRAC